MKGVLTMAMAIAVAAVSAGPAAAVSPQAQGLLDRAMAFCASFDGGTFDPADAVTPATLGTDSAPVDAEIVDESRFRCSTARSLWCGSGGCMLNVVAEGKVWRWQATGWRIERWGPSRILLIGRDGGWCGASGAEVCFEAVNWSQGRPLTVGDPPEEVKD